MSQASPSDLNARIERLESLAEIRQLAAKYALALDMRDVDARVNLFPEDVRVSKTETGRAVLKKWFDETHRLQFAGTSHHIGGHIIEFTDPENAQGIVYSKNGHEADGAWVIMQMMYFDAYARVEGRWFFRRRLPLYWYATDLNTPPIGESKMRWPDQPPYEGGFHDLFPSWAEFWASPQPDSPLAAPAPYGEFIKTSVAASLCRR